MRRRVLLVMERLPRDIFKRVLIDAADVDLVGEVANCDGIAATVQETQANLIIAESGERDAGISTFFDDYARLEVLSVEDDGENAVIFRLVPSRSAIGALTPEKLAAVVSEKPAR